MRLLGGLVAALALVLIPSAPAFADDPSVASKTELTHQAPAKKFTRYSPAKKAYTSGSVSGVITNPGAVIEDANIQVSGKISDLTKGSACGYAVFRITYQKGGQQPFTHKTYRDCTYKTPASYSFTYKHATLVELKVCSEAKHAKVSVQCLYGGAWKVVYATI
ncbi:hypothetical protein [Herbidospora mongoliensis]|uniref:hypothetical protein n=1 Tax=Herbidospora mongoliensis TaxID=688067 RepID=UPI000835FDEF|nr:hypothetical protein [Herbidospora mongoliensis]